MDAARAIRQARRRAGFTQAQLAARAGTSQAAVSAYEGGAKQPSVATLSRLLSATGSRLAVAPDGRRLQPQPEPARAGRSLVQVLELAEALPTRHSRELRFPRLPAPADRPR